MVDARGGGLGRRVDDSSVWNKYPVCNGYSLPANLDIQAIAVFCQKCQSHICLIEEIGDSGVLNMSLALASAHCKMCLKYRTGGFALQDRR